MNMQHRISIWPVIVVLLVVVSMMGMSTSGWRQRSIDEIIVHCTATPAGREVTVADIDRWHRQRGFRRIGYHYVVYLDGSIHPGRPVHEVGAHCIGHNTHSIGICYIGGLSTDGHHVEDTRTEAQRSALRALLMELKRRYPHAVIRSHRDFSSKACPCFDATKEYLNLSNTTLQ